MYHLDSFDSDDVYPPLRVQRPTEGDEEKLYGPGSWTYVTKDQVIVDREELEKLRLVSVSVFGVPLLLS